MARSLITGITGFVGSHLAEYLLSQGEEVFGIKRWRSPLKNIEHIKDDVKLYNCDLLEANALNRVMQMIKPDYVYHLAAQSYVPYSYCNPTQTIEVNAIGTTNLYQAIRWSGLKPRIHFCSTSEVYGQVKEEDVPIKETQKFNPASPYGISKAAADLISKVFAECYNMQIVITRAFTHTGPRRGEVFVVSAFAKQIAEIEFGLKDPIVKVGNLQSVRTFLDVRDIVKAYYKIIRKGASGEAYNIGGNVTMTIKEMLEQLLQMSPRKNKINISSEGNLLRPKDVTLQIPDCTKLLSTIEWQQEIPFEDTLRDTLNYWRKEVRSQ